MGAFFMCTVYVLYSGIRDKFYVGYTCMNMEERLRRHNSFHGGYTGKVKDWKIEYTETFASKVEAIKREKEIKSWKSRKRIIELIRK
jgi:putative endonuclease